MLPAGLCRRMDGFGDDADGTHWGGVANEGYCMISARLHSRSEFHRCSQPSPLVLYECAVALHGTVLLGRTTRHVTARARFCRSKSCDASAHTYLLNLWTFFKLSRRLSKLNSSKVRHKFPLHSGLHSKSRVLDWAYREMLPHCNEISQSHVCVFTITCEYISLSLSLRSL